MNIFCYPGLCRRPAVRALLGLAADAGPIPPPAFGVRVHVPFADGRTDRTEVDLQLGGLLVEAKLTEAGFQTQRAAWVERYRDLDAVFDRDALPRTPSGAYCGYQVIRGLLAAHAGGGRYGVLLDARRPDLVELCAAVAGALRSPSLYPRCQLLTWQELATTLPRPLQRFLSDKYGLT